MIPSPVKKSEIKRLHILEMSSELILHKGFTGVGLQEILKTCGVPKGSFYHYFESKEAFGCELVKYYLNNYQIRLDELWNTDQSAKDKLMSYFTLWISDPTGECGWADSCLIVKLAAEVADLSEDMRCIMAQGVDDLIALIAGLIVRGEADYSMQILADAASTAQISYQMWLGAALLGKLQKGKAPLYQALQATELMLNYTKSS